MAARGARAATAARCAAIAILMGADENDPEAKASVAAFREDLRKYGWTEGRNTQIDIRWAKADLEVMKRSAQELLTLQPDVILTSSTPAAGVMLQQTLTVPIVFVLVADPVGSRYVASLPKPGGNVTGFTPIVGSLGGKWVELLKEIAPRLGRVSLMFNPATAASFIEAFLGSFKAAAASLAVETTSRPSTDMREVESLVAEGKRE